MRKNKLFASYFDENKNSILHRQLSSCVGHTFYSDIYSGSWLIFIPAVGSFLFRQSAYFGWAKTFLFEIPHIVIKQLQKYFVSRCCTIAEVDDFLQMVVKS